MQHVGFYIGKGIQEIIYKNTINYSLAEGPGQRNWSKIYDFYYPGKLSIISSLDTAVINKKRPFWLFLNFKVYAFLPNVKELFLVWL